jgi:hypothetical protein
MIPFFRLLVVTTLIFFLSCNNQSSSSFTNSLKKDTSVSDIATNLKRNPIDYVKNYNGENYKLFAFVGQKISVEALPENRSLRDIGYKGRYKIIQKVFGSFSQDTIEFVAYDHYGIPPFSQFEHVLLFVSADSGTFYHQKYMYNDVYQTIDGKWAGTYAGDDYKHDNNKNTKIKPVLMNFKTEVSYPTKRVEENGKISIRSYPKPYYKTIGDKAIAIYGNFVDELFVLKQDGYLTAREIFTNGSLQ